MSSIKRNPNKGDQRPGNNAEVVPYWSSGICSCFSDVRVCFMTLFCPCVTFGRIAEIADQGSTPCWSSGSLYALLAFTLMPCLYSCRYRAKLRSFYSLHESPCGDCMVHFFCEFFSLCQEYRELKSRGFDMSIGWERNMERKQHLAPMVQAGMSR